MSCVRDLVDDADAGVYRPGQESLVFRQRLTLQMIVSSDETA
jgi:hypothetical protein